jgi:hypothetical protein
MARKSSPGKSGSCKRFVGGLSRRCSEDEESRHDDRALAAIGRSVAAWTKANAEPIKSSSPEECAAKSYMGGMFDMLMVSRHALGIWGAEQIVSQLERMSCEYGPVAPDEHEAPGEIRVRISSKGKSQEEVVEEAKELGMHIAKWVKERSESVKKKGKDPMFG